jgi:hypothetical protein
VVRGSGLEDVPGLLDAIDESMQQLCASTSEFAFPSLVEKVFMRAVTVCA